MPSPLGVTSVLGGATGVTSAVKPAAAPGGDPAGAFARELGKLVTGVEQTNTDANEAVGAMLNKTGEVHDAMIALQRAEMSLQMTVAVRNKLVQAYNDIMRMPV